MNKAVESAKERYVELFPDDRSKAKAFDAVAERYFFANFGTISKSDMDTLMFSLYIEQILDKSEGDISTYSDYTLSKLFGITQAKIANLKVKKELQYPYEGFTWQKSFERVLENYRYENGKIILFIPDKNLYLELKNAIEECGGYVERTLNPTLLQITPEYFIDLLLVTSPEKDRGAIIAEVRKEFPKHNIDVSEVEKKSVGDILKNTAPDIAVEVISAIIENSVPVVGSTLGATLRSLVTSIKNKQTGGFIR